MKLRLAIEVQPEKEGTETRLGFLIESQSIRNISQIFPALHYLHIQAVFKLLDTTLNHIQWPKCLSSVLTKLNFSKPLGKSK